MKILFTSFCILWTLNMAPLAMNGAEEIGTQDQYAPPETNRTDNNALFNGYKASADSGVLWARVRAVVSPGALSGASYTAYTITNMSEAEIKKILMSKKFGFTERAAKPAASKITRYARQTPVKGILLVIATYDGVLSAYNLVVDPKLSSEIPTSKTWKRSGQDGALPTISAESEEGYLTDLPRRPFILRNLKYIVAGAAGAVMLIVFLVFRRKGYL